jgi:hypothetical protein
MGSFLPRLRLCVLLKIVSSCHFLIVIYELSYSKQNASKHSFDPRMTRAMRFAGVLQVLHRHGALAFFDYGAAGPYLPIDMNPVVLGDDGRPNPYVYKDAVFVSLHKFPGGPGESHSLLLAHTLSHEGSSLFVLTLYYHLVSYGLIPL